MSEPEPPGYDGCVRALFAQHGRAMVAVAAATLGAFATTIVLGPGRLDERLVQAFGVQLVVMALLVPAATFRPAEPLAVLLRAGMTMDAFGLGLLAVAAASPQLGVWQALKAYILATAVGLLLLAVGLRLRDPVRPRLAGAFLTAAVGVGVAVGLFYASSRQGPLAWGGLPPLVRTMLANADLHAAAKSALESRTTPPPWQRTAGVYAAAAALIWLAPRGRMRRGPGS